MHVIYQIDSKYYHQTFSSNTRHSWRLDFHQGVHHLLYLYVRKKENMSLYIQCNFPAKGILMNPFRPRIAYLLVCCVQPQVVAFFAKLRGLFTLMPHPRRILPKYTKFGESEMHPSDSFEESEQHIFFMPSSCYKLENGLTIKEINKKKRLTIDQATCVGSCHSFLSVSSVKFYLMHSSN